MVFVYTKTLLAGAMKPLHVLSKFENHFVIRTVCFQVQLEADGYFLAQEVFEFAFAASSVSWYHLAIFESDFTNPTSKTLVGLRPNRISSTKVLTALDATTGAPKGLPAPYCAHHDGERLTAEGKIGRRRIAANALLTRCFSSCIMTL